MADQSAFYAILGKALAEPEFRESLRHEDSRHRALADLKIDLTSEQHAELENAVAAIDRVADQFGLGTFAA